jgi:hypothetical protein
MCTYLSFTLISVNLFKVKTSLIRETLGLLLQKKTHSVDSIYIYFNWLYKKYITPEVGLTGQNIYTESTQCVLFCDTTLIFLMRIVIMNYLVPTLESFKML